MAGVISASGKREPVWPAFKTTKPDPVLGKMPIFYKNFINFAWTLKKLALQISTLVQKLVLTLLNNEFILKIQKWTPFVRNIRNIFGQKTKVRFSLYCWFLGLCCNNKKFHIFIFLDICTWHTKTPGSQSTCTYSLFSKYFSPKIKQVPWMLLAFLFKSKKMCIKKKYLCNFM